MSNASKHQPAPQEGEIIVVDVVLDDIRERAETGKLKYGTYLQTNNGRDALWDAYQEALDGVMYLRQEILEKEQATATLADMQARIEKLAEYPERLQKAITELRALISPTLSRSEQERIAGKIEGVKIALFYFEEMTR